MIVDFNTNLMGLRSNKIMAEEFSAPYGSNKRPSQLADVQIIPLRNDVLSKLIHDLVFDEKTFKMVSARIGGK